MAGLSAPAIVAWRNGWAEKKRDAIRHYMRNSRYSVDASQCCGKAFGPTACAADFVGHSVCDAPWTCSSHP